MEATPKNAEPGSLVPTFEELKNDVLKLSLIRVRRGDEWEETERFANAVLNLKSDQNITVDVAGDVDPLIALLELLAREPKNRDVCADLLAAVFAGFAIHKDLTSVANRFARSVTDNHTLGSLLREICGTVNLTPDYKPGVYSVVAKLALFGQLSVSLLRALRLTLGSVLRTLWVPLWTYEALPDLYSSVLSQSLLLATTQEHKLDFLIASRGHNVLQWHELKDRNTTAINFFLYRVARRVIQCRNHVSESFANFLRDFLSQTIDNDCFKKLDESTAFNLSVFMEIVDHPDLNFLEEPHLIAVLNSALRHTRNLCENGHIQTLHMELGTMGSTQSLFGLTNILQYILARFLVDTGNLMFNATHLDSDKSNWAMRSSPYELPEFFDQVVPDIPPIARAGFGLQEKNPKFPIQTSEYSITVLLMLECLNHVMLINKNLLIFYGVNDLDLSLEVKDASQDKDNDESQVVETKSKSEISELYFVAITSVLLLCRQFQDEVFFGTLIDEQEAYVQSRIMTLNALKCFEALVSTLEGASLYQFIKFSSRISLIDLSMHAVSMQILSHVSFQSRLSALQGPTLTNKLIRDALYSQIILWNDGTDTYSRFLTDVFSIEAPPVTFVSLDASEFLGIMFPQDNTQTALTEPSPQFVRTSDSSEFRKGYQYTKFNAHANSFVPSSRSQYNRAEVNSALQQIERHHSSSRSAEGVKPPNSSIEGLDLRPSFPTGRQQATITKELGATFSGSASIPLNNGTSWSPNCFSQGPLSSPDTGSAVSTGKNYILGGHNRAANNSRAQSVHVDRFNYLQQ
ncbi:LAFA_0E17084g1_1 [Lachancea sp. 'fantastica']|nr:LAFA_0E17084g1_1 [Lachancea sp. 'fantastica']